MKENEPPATLSQVTRSGETASAPETRNRPFASQAQTREHPFTSQQSENSPRSIDLQIDELVLNGFAAADRDRIVMAFESEMTRLFTDHGVPSALMQSGEITLQPQDGFQISHGDSDLTGRRLAQAIYGGLTK